MRKVLTTLVIVCGLSGAAFAGLNRISPNFLDGDNIILPVPPVSGGGGGFNIQPVPPVSGGGIVPLAVDELFWDPNGTTAGTGGGGNWVTSNTSMPWRNGSTAGALQAWAAGNNSHFEGTAGTVTISGGTTVSPATSFFELTGYVLSPTNTSVTTLGGSISLSASVNLTLNDPAVTAGREFAIGSVTGGAGSSLTVSGAQTASGSVSRVDLSQAGASIDVPITIAGTGTSAAGFVATATGTGITGTIATSATRATLLGAASGDDLTLSSTAVISGTGSVLIGVNNTSVNVGTVTLNAANLYSGGTTLNGGTLVLGNDTALGTGTLTLSNSTTSVLQAGGGARTLANNVVWGGNGTISGSQAFVFNGTFTSSGSDSRTVTVSNTGGVTLNGNVFLQEAAASGRTLTFNGTSAVVINGVVADGGTGPASLKYTGSSTLTLSNTNTYSGGTLLTVAGSTLIANHDGALGTGNVSLTATTVTLTLQNGVISNYIADTATLSYVGGDTINLNYVGTDTVMGLTVNGVAQAPGLYGATATNPDGVFTGTGFIVVVPEPGTIVMFGLGLGLLAGVNRFRHRRS